MQLHFKDYQKLKIKKYLNKDTLLLFSIGANQNSQNWINIEQGLHKLELSYYKTYNNVTKKIMGNSIYRNSINTINSTFFYLTPKTRNRIKTNLLNIVKSVFFTVLSIKLNDRIYALPQLKNINSLTYKNNIAIMYQFLITNFKLSYKIAYRKTTSKQCDSNT